MDDPNHEILNTPPHPSCTTTTTTTAGTTFIDESFNKIKNAPSIYLILENPRKTCNWGPVLRCAAAFAVTQVVWVGYSTCNTEGSHGAASHVSQIAFPVLSQAISHVRGESSSSTTATTTTIYEPRTTAILGIVTRGAGGASHQNPYPLTVDSSHETSKHCFLNASKIDPTSNDTELPLSYPIRHHPLFSSSPSSLRSLAIILSKDSLGLPLSLASVCDSFVHIPHLPLDDRIFCPLDVPSSLSIVLHHVRKWSPYPERNSHGHKFHVETCHSVRSYQRQSPICQESHPLPLEDEDILDSELLENFFSLDEDSQVDDNPGMRL
jgi:hypothetical protein